MYAKLFFKNHPRFIHKDTFVKYNNLQNIMYYYFHKRILRLHYKMSQNYLFASETKKFTKSYVHQWNNF